MEADGAFLAHIRHGGGVEMPPVTCATATFYWHEPDPTILYALIHCADCGYQGWLQVMDASNAGVAEQCGITVELLETDAPATVVEIFMKSHLGWDDPRSVAAEAESYNRDTA